MSEYYATAEYAEFLDTAFSDIEKGVANQNQILAYLNEMVSGWVRETMQDKSE